MSKASAAVLAGLILSLAAAPAFAACTIVKVAELPVTMSGTKPLVPVKVNGVDEMFVADSGAFYSTINANTAAQVKLAQTQSNLVIRGVGGESGFTNIGTAKTLSLAGQTIPDAEFVVTEGVGQYAGGLGQNILGAADVEYDLGSGVIRIFQPRNCPAEPLAYWAKDVGYSVISIDPIDRQNARTSGTAFINGVKIKVVFDTGAGRSGLTRESAEKSGIKMDSPDVRFVGLGGGFGARATKNWIAPVTSFKIGDEEIRTTRLTISDFSYNDVGGDMLLGADFFLSHRVYVSNSQHKMYFTYNGGPVFRYDASPLVQAGPSGAPQASADVAVEEPTDADGYARRGAAFAARHDFDRAIADLSRACELAPTEPKYFYQRAVVHVQNRQPALAMADLDQTLKFAPKNIDALLMRGGLRIQERDKTGSADLDAVSAMVPKEADVRFRLGVLYGIADMFDASIAQFDLWVTAHPDDGRMVQAFNGRCWARAAAGKDLNKALDDCNRAVAGAPKTAAFLDSRGLVELRLGDNDKAIADYDAALTLQPKLGWSLYGRGLAKRRKGLKAEGDADVAAAVAINPKLPQAAKQFGIVGPDGA